MGLFTAILLGYATYKRTADNRLTENVINMNVQDAENLIARIDRNMDAAVKRCDDALERLYKANKTVYQSTFPKFVEIGSQIMNIEFDDRQESFRKLGSKAKIVSGINISYTDSIISRDYGVAAVILSSIVSPAALLSQTIYSVKLKATLAEAKTELSRIQAAVEVAKREIAKMRSITTLADTATETVKSMQLLTDRAVCNLEQQLNSYGTDYRAYPETVKNEVWLTFKMVSVLNELVNMQILTSSGAISGKFRKFVGEINSTFLEG